MVGLLQVMGKNQQARDVVIPPQKGFVAAVNIFLKNAVTGSRHIEGIRQKGQIV